jgi:spermidine synthase
MTTPADPRPAAAHPVLFALFVGSGCSALIYEIVWFQLLQMLVGSTAVSLAVLLGTYMGGMCLGSLGLSRVVSATRHPLRVYAVLELGIAAVGVAILFLAPALYDSYASLDAGGPGSLVARVVVCVVCLLVPTVLMGATLPAVARWVEATPTGVSWLGLFYGGNIVGAVAGCLLAGFYLLRVYDSSVATYVAAGINVAVALLAYAVAAVVPHRPVAVVPAGSAGPVPDRWPVYLALGLSGAAALGAEVVWTRLLSLLLGGTVYTFSIILAVFLTGLGIGSTAGAGLAKSARSPRLTLAFVQALVVAAVTWSAFQLTTGVPYWPSEPRYAEAAGPWRSFQFDLVRCLFAILPAAVLWGMSFPLALAAVASPGRDAGRVVGGAYAANTLGAIAGAVAFGVFVVPQYGSRSAGAALVAIAAAAAIVLLAFPVRTLTVARALTVLIVAGVAAFAAKQLPETPWQLIAYGRNLPRQQNDEAECLFVGEGMNSSVAVVRDSLNDRNFYVSGKIEASSTRTDMRLQRMLGHIPALLHPNPKTVLVVGCGAGVTAGSFLTHPSVERVVICEIEPLIPTRVAPHFKDENYDVVNDPRVTIVYDDARHYMLTARETFDVITSDPIHPWVKGAASLYTKEYFDLVKKRLNPGGVVSQWVPLYQSSPAVVKSEVATFLAAFPDGTVWGNAAERLVENQYVEEGYDTVVLGRADAGPIDLSALSRRVDRPDHERVAASLRDVGFHTLRHIIGTYACRASDMKDWLADAAINHDRNLRLQYLAGLGVNAVAEGAIYDAMRKGRTFPEDLFAVPEANRADLKAWLGFGPRNP